MAIQARVTLAGVVTLTLALLSRPGEVKGQLDFGYHNASQLEAFMVNISQTYPDITHLYSIGRSINGTDLWVMAIGENPEEDVLLRPNVKYVGNIHGGETVGREQLLHFIEYLVSNYGVLDNVTSLLSNTLVHVLPAMNPDGYAKAWDYPYECIYDNGRGNALGYDLNRNFPDFFREQIHPLQQETRLTMDWMAQTQFVLSANLHGGAVCVNYPFDTYLGNSTDAKPHWTPDQDVFHHISLEYTRIHPFYRLPEYCLRYNFTDGITNGAEWYPLTGGMQDYNYLRAGCLEVTLEVSCCKFPPPGELQGFWLAERDALLHYLMLVHMGVKGIVRDTDGNPVPGAVIAIQGRELATANTTARGEYWRMLLPGFYRLMVTRDTCVQPTVVQFYVAEGVVTRLDVTLDTVAEVSGAPSGLLSTSLSLTLSLVASLVVARFV